MALSQALADHLASAHTTLARCWAVTRADGVVMGFTDHDRDLSFEGVSFHADTGLSAQALTRTTGLSIDNSEALGALSAAAIREDDVAAGRYDGAEVTAWLVNWQDVAQRVVLFQGQIGEVTRVAGGFKAELLGLSAALNQPQGRAYHAGCGAVLGDSQCRVDLSVPGYASERAVEAVEDATRFTFAGFTGFDDRWFERGKVTVLSGEAAGLVGVVKNDRLGDETRVIELWQAIRAPVAPGDLIRIEAGCDKRAETCRFKFDNILNFRGFPDIPGEDWLMSAPTRSGG